MNVSGGGYKMGLIQYARIETALPKVALCFHFFIKVLGIAHVGGVKCPGKRIFFMGNCYEMYVVIH